MRIFAPDQIIAKSRFWYYLKKMKKMKKTSGQILAVHQVTENTNTVKNYAVWARYRGNLNHQDVNITRQYRATGVNDLVHKTITELCGQYKARRDNIDILGIKKLTGKECTASTVAPFINSKLSFPHFRK